RGFPRRVGAENGGDGAAPDIERDVVEHAQVPERFGKMTNLDHLELLFSSRANPAAWLTAMAGMLRWGSTSASGVKIGITRSAVSMMDTNRLPISTTPGGAFSTSSENRRTG